MRNDFPLYFTNGEVRGSVQKQSDGSYLFTGRDDSRIEKVAGGYVGTCRGYPPTQRHRSVRSCALEMLKIDESLGVYEDEDRVFELKGSLIERLFRTNATSQEGALLHLILNRHLEISEKSCILHIPRYISFAETHTLKTLAFNMCFPITSIRFHTIHILRNVEAE